MSSKNLEKSDKLMRFGKGEGKNSKICENPEAWKLKIFENRVKLGIIGARTAGESRKSRVRKPKKKIFENL